MDRTCEEKGAKKVPIEGTEDKRGITVVLTSSKGGEKCGPEMLPTQALGGGLDLILQPHNFATHKFCNGINIATA